MKQTTDRLAWCLTFFVLLSVTAEEWSWQRTLVPRALLVEGLWSDTTRLREAVREAGLPYDTAYKSRSAYWRPQDRLVGMPAEVEPYRKYAVIVLNNIDAETLTAERIAIIDRFVRAGGGLVIFGGHWVYDRGGYGGTALAEMLPVTMPPQRRIPAHRQGLPLHAAAEANWPLDYPFQAEPRAFYVQELAPKTESIVQLQAGELPAVVSGSYGKGRVVAMALTPHGEAGEGALAFWEWESWPRLFGQIIEWAAGGRPSGREMEQSQDAGDAILDDLLALELEPDALTPELLNTAMRQVNAQSASLLLRLALATDTRAIARLSLLLPHLLPFAEPGWGDQLEIASGRFNADLEERRAALILLGASRSSGSFATLSAALDDEPVRTAAAEGLGHLGDARAIPMLRNLYARAGEAALSDTFVGEIDPECYAREAAHTLLAAALGLYRLGEEKGVPRLLEAHQQAHLYHRIFRNAAKRRVLDKDTQGLAIKRQIIAQGQALESSLAHLYTAALPIPPSQIEALTARCLAPLSEEDLFLLEHLLQASAGDTRFSAEEWKPLLNSSDGIIRRIGVALVQQAELRP